jgi:hypothetical protein
MVQKVEENECLAHGQTVFGIFSIYIPPYPAGYRPNAKAIKAVKYVHVIFCLSIPRRRIKEKIKYLSAPGQSTTYIRMETPVSDHFSFITFYIFLLLLSEKFFMTHQRTADDAAAIP